MRFNPKLVKKVGLYIKPSRNFLSSWQISGLYLLLIQPGIAACQYPKGQVENPAFQVVINQYVNHTVPEMEMKNLDDPQNYLFLDTRSYSEYQISHIPGALWVGYNDFSLDRVSHIAKDQTLMVYCSIGYRSEKVSEILKEAGYQEIYNLVGGIFEWINTGHTVENHEGLVQKVHGYSSPFGVFVEGVTVVYD